MTALDEPAGATVEPLGRGFKFRESSCQVTSVGPLHVPHTVRTRHLSRLANLGGRRRLRHLAGYHSLRRLDRPVRRLRDCWNARGRRG